MSRFIIDMGREASREEIRLKSFRPTRKQMEGLLELITEALKESYMEHTQAQAETADADASMTAAIAQKELPRYKCHKLVCALQIDTVEPNAEGALLTFKDGFGPRQVVKRIAETPSLSRGGYLVIYTDGYESFSPQKQFEEGYDRI